MNGWYWLLAFAVSLFAGLFAGGYWISGLLRYGRRHPISRTPGDAGLDYEDVTFQSSDGLTLAGWWLPASADPRQDSQHPVTVMLHPWLGNRHGFCAQSQGRLQLLDQSVDLLQMACAFHAAGFSVLMFDFREHGESQAGICAGGLSEDQDVAGALEYVFNRLSPVDPLVRPSQRKIPPVGVVGFGLGAAAAMAAVGRTKGGYQTIRIFSGDMEGGVGYSEIPPSPVKQLRFIVLVQPAALGTLVRNSLADRLSLLGRALLPVVDRCYQWRGGHAFENTGLDKFVAGIQMPVMLVQARDDPWGSGAEVQRLYNGFSGCKQIWWLDGIAARPAAYEYVGQNPGKILAFAADHAFPPPDPSTDSQG